MFNVSTVIRRAKELGARRILLQLPDGLKPRAAEIIRQIEANGTDVILSVDPCYGACDLRDREAKTLGCDALVHVGHSDMGVRSEVPVIYAEYAFDFDFSRIRHLLEKIEQDRIGLVTTLQYTGLLQQSKEFLESRKKKVFIGRPSVAKYSGQILGCDVSAGSSIEHKIDAFLFIGSGRFHPLGLAARTERPVLFLDIERLHIEDLSEEAAKLRMRRRAGIEKARECSDFGVVVSTKAGQCNPRLAESVKSKLRAKGKRAVIISASEITPEKIMGMGLDCLVTCACPRISEDSQMFRVPILLPEEIDIL